MFDGERVAGRQIYYPVTIATDRKEGVEAFEQPVTFTEDFWAEVPGGFDESGNPKTVPMDDLKYRIIECRPNVNKTAVGAVVIGKNNPLDPALAHKSVSDSGTCVPTRADEKDYTAPYKISLSGIDTSGEHFPTETLAGADLSAGPYYVASYEVIIFVPLTELDRTNGVMNDGIGSFKAYNQVTGFDPVGITGASNFGDNKNEPGFCADRSGGAFAECDPMEDGKRSNNVAGPNDVSMSPGNFSKSFINHFTAWSHGSTNLPGVAGAHDGNATVQPGEVHQAQVIVSNSGASWTEVGLCDVFDNTTLKLAPLNQLTGMTEANRALYPDNLYAYVHDTSLTGNRQTQEPNQENYVVEYGVFDFKDDTANNGEFDLITNRYGGSWSNQAKVSCSDDATTWFTDLSKVPGGIDAVNAVRAVTAEDTEIAIGSSLRLMTAYEQRDTFNGGPKNGEHIPAGTVAANYGQASTDTLYPDWSMTDKIKSRYVPQPETSSTDGDRWTVIRATANLDQRTIKIDGIGSGAADFGQTGQAIGGDPVIWETVATLSANSATPGEVKNVVITQTLPKYATYNEEMTRSVAGGTPATTAVVNDDGTTTLTWQLGDLLPNQKIQPRIVYTDTDGLAPKNTSLVAHSVITADAMIAVAAHSDEHAVTLQQSGNLQLKKSVDQVLDLENDTQEYLITIKNPSETLSLEPVTIIDVLPHNGDATNDARVNRSPESNYSGTSTLQGPVVATDFGGTNAHNGTTYYTTIDPKKVPQNLNADTDQSIWVTEDKIGVAGGPQWEDITAFKFVSSENLTTIAKPAKSGMHLTFVTEQNGNAAGDLYANRFTAFSKTFSSAAGDYQLLTSNQTTVRVVGFSLGDLIWIDQNNNGVFDSADDTTAPEGVTVEVYKAKASGFSTLFGRLGEDELVGTATTNNEGRWILNDLAEGDYYAVIPAAEFADGGKLHGYVVSTNNSSAKPNDDLNEDKDHHAIAHDGGVRTAGVITLSATVNGSKITGDEPLGDNVGSLRASPLTTDDFTNFTLDMALAPVPGYEFSKTSNPGSGTAVNPGDTITYTLTGGNTGTTVLEPVEIIDDLSGVLEHAKLTGDVVVTITSDQGDTRDGGTAVLTGTTLSWVGALEIGERVEIVYSVTLNDDAVGAILENKASSEATPPGLPPITPPEVVTEHPVPGYEFAKTSDPESGTAVEAGGTITYTVTGTNTGATVLDPVEITDDLSGVLEHAKLTGDVVVTITNGEGESRDAEPAELEGAELSWVGTLEVGETVTVTYSVQLNDDATGVVVKNRASSSATPPGLPPITPPAVETYNPTPGYTFWKGSDPASDNPVAVGESITYTLNGQNNGETALEPVTITDDLSEVLAHATLDGEITAVIIDAEDQVRNAAAPQLDGTTLAWSGSLAIGEQVVVSYTVTVNEGSEGATLTNRAASTATPPGLPPITPPEMVTEHPVPGYTLGKTSDPADGKRVNVGDTINYTVTGTNTGATALEGVVVSDDLSGVLTHTTMTGDPVAVIIDEGGTETEATAPVLTGTKLEWTGNLAIGERIELRYGVTVNDDAVNVTITNIATSHGTPPGGTVIVPPPVETTHTTPPPGLSLTGADYGMLAGAGVLALLLGAAFVVRARRKTVG